MTLSIVIPSHNRADLLRPCLASVHRHAPTRTQIIVVDDGSRDAIVSRTADEFPGTTVVRHERARGFCAAANAGVAAATGDFVELLNDDTETTTGWAESALANFDDPNVVAVAPLLLQHGTDGIIDSAGDDYDRGGFATKRGHGRRFDPNGEFAAPANVRGACAAAAFYRREALLRAGGFPEEFVAYFDDVDLALRLGRLGILRYDPRSVVWHHVSASHGKTPNRRLVERQSRNEELLYWRNAVGRERWTTLPRHVAVLAGKSVRRWQEGRLTAWSVGRVRVWMELAMTKRARPA